MDEGPVDRDHPVELVVSGFDARSGDGGADARSDGGSAMSSDEEELAQPAGFPRLRRARVPLTVGAAVALMALVVVHTADGPSGTPAAGPATVTVSPSPTQTLRLPSGHRTALREGVLPVGVTCPVGSACEVRFGTPRTVALAVLASLPTASALRTVTTSAHGGAPGSQLRARRVVGRVGRSTLSVDVVPAGAHDRLGWDASENAARTEVTASRHVRGDLVTVRVSGPPGYEIGISAVRRLAGDARLTRYG